MFCKLTAILVGVYTGGELYTACQYRCPRERSFFYYHYPKTIRVPYGAPCPSYARVK